ncbi:hypothetical protein GCM10022382_16880 [Microbacterium invictum]
MRRVEPLAVPRLVLSVRLGGLTARRRVAEGAGLDPTLAPRLGTRYGSGPTFAVAAGSPLRSARNE